MIAARIIGSRLETGRRAGARTRDRQLQPGHDPRSGRGRRGRTLHRARLAGRRQPAIETAFAKRHLKNGTLVLYDVSSSYMEGRCCSLAHRGYSRDGRKGTLQIVYGLLCAPDGARSAIEVFDGNTGDPTTLAVQVRKLKQRFGSITSCSWATAA